MLHFLRRHFDPLKASDDVTRAPNFPDTETAPVRVPLLLVGCAALVAGLYGRFKGIGTWPLGVDEFYLSRSVDHILTSGFPAFPCGGYYTRGLLFQYLVAGLRRSGMSPEFAGRFLAGTCGLAVVPAGYFLGRRIQGSLTGWLTAIILLVSIWEIEMSRFGRMYAPFQAVFACYLLFYLRYTINRDEGALRWMIALSIVGILTWEGGTLLGLANIFAVMQSHEHGRLKAVDWRRLAGLLGLLALLYLASRDLRGFAQSTLPAAAAATAADHPQIVHAWISGAQLHAPWVFAFLVPFGLVVMAARFAWSYRSRWMTSVGLCLVLLAALFHAFTAAAGMLALMLLMGLLEWRALTTGQGRRYLLALGCLLLFWLGYALLTGGEPLQVAFGLPDVFQRILRPWGRTMPVMTLGLLVAVLYWFWKTVAVAPPGLRPMASLLGLLLLMVLAVSAIPTERIETRYTFFLYPLLLVLTVAAILEFLRHGRTRRRLPTLLLAGAPLLCFAASEDLQIRQIAHIDSAAMNFRIGMSAARRDHYYPSSDMRGVGGWLSENVRPGDVVISGIPSLDEYFSGIDYFYFDAEDNRYDAYICRDGRTERWTNHKVLYRENGLESAVSSGHSIYATVYGDVEERLRRDARSRGWSFERIYTSIDGQAGVVKIVARSGDSDRN
jgi:hypothetical protein